MRYGAMHQGFETERIVLIAADGNTIKTVWALATRQDPNDVLCSRALADEESCIHYSIEYHFVPGSNSAYFDILTTEKVGTGPNVSSSVATFSFVDDKYVRKTPRP